MQESDVIDEEDTGLRNLLEILDDPFRADRTVTAPIEGPSATEVAIPGAAPGELDLCAWIEHADEVLLPASQKLARRTIAVEITGE